MAVKKAETKKTSAVAAKVNIDTAATAEKTVKQEAVKASPAKKAVPEKKPVAEKKTAAEKKPVKKASAVKAAAKKSKTVKKEVYLQFAGKEMLVDELTQKAQDIWTKELGNKVADIESFQIYLKPEESAAYYVINDVSGKVEL